MDNELRKEIGKYFVDISKLFIGGAVLSSVIKIEGLTNYKVIIIGSIVSLTLAAFGFFFMSKKNKNQRYGIYCFIIYFFGCSYRYRYMDVVC